MWISGDLIEKDPSIGGHMSQLSETFPTLDCSQCILTPRMVEVAQHPNITLYTYAELESLEGFIGNFKASIRLKAKSIDEKLCTGCGLCTTKCPTKKIPSEFNAGLGMRTAIYVPFPQAVPNKPVIDRVHCTHFGQEDAVFVKRYVRPELFVLTKRTVLYQKILELLWLLPDLMY